MSGSVKVENGGLECIVNGVETDYRSGYITFTPRIWAEAPSGVRSVSVEILSPSQAFDTTSFQLAYNSQESWWGSKGVKLKGGYGSGVAQFTVRATLTSNVGGTAQRLP